MTDYFEANDGHGESTIWRVSVGHPPAPVAVIRRSDVPNAYWPDVVVRMTTDIDALKAERDYWRGNAEDYASMLAANRVTTDDATHGHRFVDVSTFADADAGRHHWLCECGVAQETRDRA